MLRQEDDGGMDRLGDGAAQRTDAQLADTEAALLLRTNSVQLLAFKPQVSDPATFDRILAAVKQSTARNENIAQLNTRLAGLGAGAMGVAKEICALAARLG